MILYTSASYVAAKVPLWKPWKGFIEFLGCMNMRADAPTFMPYTEA